MRPRGKRTYACKRCGSEIVNLDKETADHLKEWTSMHPLRGIPNWPNVPLFPTKDEARIQKVLEWSRAHPGEFVPEDLMMSVRADENDAEATVMRLLVESGGLEKFPHVVWTFHMTGFMPTEQNFDGMPPEDQRECEAAWAQWDAMSETERAQFATKMRAYVAALPA